jgi:hypothetical protein
MGAAGGAFAPAAGGLGGATAEGAGSIAGSTAVVDSAASAFPVSGGSSLTGTQFAGTPLANMPTGITGLIEPAAMQQAAGNTTNLATTAAPTIGSTPQAGKGFFDSGFGKTIADNKVPLGLGALGLMVLKPQGGSTPEQDSYIRPHTYDPSTQTYTAQAPVKSTDWGTRSVAEGGIIGMADGGMTTEEQRENRTNPTLEALSAIQQQQPTYQPPAPQGITQPLIQPQMAQIQQQYTAPQRQAPAAFQYQAPSFTQYANTPVSAGAATGLDQAGINALYQEYLGRDVDPTGLSANKGQSADAVKKSILASAEYKNKLAGASSTSAGAKPADNPAANPAGITSANVYDYANNTPTRVVNPAGGSPEFNVASNVPVDLSSGLAETQQRYANMGYTDYVPPATNDYFTSAANGGLMQSYAMGGGIGGYYPAPDDGNHNFDGISGLNQGPQYPMQGIAHSAGGTNNYAMGGQLGGYSDGGQLLKGPGDGVSDDIPAQIGDRQPARLADGEFVVPARIVSELGNGSTDAGAKRLYAMMDRIQKNRGRTVGKGKVAVNSRSDKYLPA